MTAYNRKVARKRLASIFEDELVGTGLPVSAVFSYDVRDFKGQSPVVSVRSSGIRRQPFGQASTKYRNWIPLAVMLFVKDETTGWTAEQAADAMDDCEAAIVQSIMDHRKEVGYWNNMTLENSYSNIYNVTVGGDPYLLEIMTVLVEVIDA